MSLTESRAGLAFRIAISESWGRSPVGRPAPHQAGRHYGPMEASDQFTVKLSVIILVTFALDAVTVTE
jgi:hypothetical protein